MHDPPAATLHRALPFLTFSGEDLRKLENGVHVVSGTPGRVFDMIKRKALRTRAIKTLILDEADEMLAKNFKDQIYDIYRYVTQQVCTTVLSFWCTQETLISSIVHHSTTHASVAWGLHWEIKYLSLLQFTACFWESSTKKT